VKVDHGMKLFIRYWRDGLIYLFSKKGYGVGLHHWKIDRWRIEAQRFAIDVLGYQLSSEDLNGLIMLLYSAFGAAVKKVENAKKGVPIKDSDKEKLKIYEGLGRHRK
jgi:hypothetical protein